ncbi:MAG: beta-ketoacyl-[acyl-carrier-protein] synthase family protein [Planctomycetaceae bacterium]|nr:beta-ketoacyl-[acyl-carrier-protein] synthase family protein [Planctomycetaceae bacterium]
MSSSSAARRRVVITGLGVVSPLGLGPDAFWERLSKGESGIHAVGPEANAAPGHAGGQVPDFSDEITKEVMPKKQRKFVRVMCREIELGVVAALSAVAQSKIDLEQIDHDRFGVDFGANLMFSPPNVLQDACWSVTERTPEGPKFNYDRWGGHGLNVLEPLWLLKYLPNMPACHIGIAVEARGPNNSLTLEDASGNLAVGEASRIIQRDRADIMIAGTTGTKLNSVKTMHAALWHDLAEGDGPPETWCRPFDASRTGQVVAEGACALILETPEHAAGRGAIVYGEILGMGSSCVTNRDGSPDIATAVANALKAALRDAQVDASDVGHVNAHGVAIRSVDVAEAEGIGRVFPHGVPVTALKSYFGNAGAGAGVQELAGSLLALRNGVVPRTLNCEQIDPDCPIDVVRETHRPTDNRLFVNINVTRAGQASALVVRAA